MQQLKEHSESTEVLSDGAPSEIFPPRIRLVEITGVLGNHLHSQMAYMKPSDLKSSPDDSFPFTDSTNQVVAPQLPWFSVFALISIPLLTVCSLPFWRENIEQQIASAAASSNASNSGRGGGFAMVAAGFFTAIAASYVGLIFTFLAQKKRERWVGLRIAAWLINGISASLGTFLFLKYFLKVG